jgi:hypothetical protein
MIKKMGPLQFSNKSYILLLPEVSLLFPEDGGKKIIRTVGTYLTNYIQDDLNLDTCRGENLKSHTLQLSQLFFPRSPKWALPLCFPTKVWHDFSYLTNVLNFPTISSSWI